MPTQASRSLFARCRGIEEKLQQNRSQIEEQRGHLTEARAEKDAGEKQRKEEQEQSAAEEASRAAELRLAALSAAAMRHDSKQPLTAMGMGLLPPDDEIDADARQRERTTQLSAVADQVRDPEGDESRRHKILFKAPGGPAAALSESRPASLAPNPKINSLCGPRRGTSKLTPRDGASSSLSSVATMIGLTHADEGSVNVSRPWGATAQTGALQLRLQAMERNAHQNALLLDSHRSHLTEVISARKNGPG